MTFEVVVIANRHRSPLIVPHIMEKFLPARIHIVDDFLLPTDPISPKVHKLAGPFILGQYRCWRGHRDAMLTGTADIMFILEDDAVPNRPDWWEVVTECMRYLDTAVDCDVLSLHGRAVQNMVEKNDRIPGFNDLRIFTPGKDAWSQGSLAYLANRQGRAAILACQEPVHCMDIALLEETRFNLLVPSPFEHDRSQGSLIER